jgi:hypothetical protein
MRPTVTVKATLTRVLAVAALGVTALPSAAFAFSNHTSFAEPAENGGGGERYFTGSVRDGYTCAVCHRGGPIPADVTIAGIPEDGFVPGAVVNLTITVDNGNGAAFEIVSQTGSGVGTLAVTPEDCLAAPTVTAVWSASPGNGRTVAGLDGCSTNNRLQVAWTAPATIDPVWINFVVVGNAGGNGEPTEDGVYVYSYLLPAVGDGADSARVSGTCATARGPGSLVAPAFLTLLLGLLARRRR